MEKFLLNLGLPKPTYDSQLSEAEAQRVEAELQARAQELGPKIWGVIDKFGDSGVQLSGPNSRFRGSKTIPMGEFPTPDRDGRTHTFVTVSAFLIRGSFDALNLHYYTGNSDGTMLADIGDSFYESTIKWPRWENGDMSEFNHIEAVIAELEATPVSE